MFDLGAPELVVILLIAFFVFGAKRLPEIGAGLGKGIRAFKAGLNDPEGAVKSDAMSSVAEEQHVSPIGHEGHAQQKA